MRNPVHPGAILRDDVLVELGLSVSEAAERLGVSRVTLSRVLHEHARISPNLAVRLEAVPGLPCSQRVISRRSEPRALPRSGAWIPWPDPLG